MNEWLKRAIKTHNYHANKVQINPRWGLQDTADALDRSIGSISDDLKLALAYATIPERLTQFEYAKDALIFLRSRKRVTINIQLDSNA